MSAKTIQLGSFCGGTSKLLDSEFMGHETSVNCYPETVSAGDTYSTKMLKCIEGFTEQTTYGSHSWTGENSQETPLFLASKSPSISHNGGKPVVYSVQNDYLIRIYEDGNCYDVARFWDGTYYVYPVSVTFCETSGDPAYVIICGKFSYTDSSGDTAYENLIFCCSLATQDTPWGSNAPKITALTLPDAYDHTGKISPTKIAYLNYRLIVNDEGHDYIYWSELNKPNGVHDEYAFCQQLTRYAYTQSDSSGTVIKTVTFSDNQYYPPSYGCYDEDSLQTETVWMSALNNVKVDFRADNIQNIIALDRSFIVFGSLSYQIYQWQNSQYAPFISSSQTSMVGLRSPDAVTEYNDSVYFLGSGKTGENAVWRAGESSLERISTTAIEQKIASVVDQDKSFAFSYTYKGHAFVVLTFYGDDDNFTLCYDIKEGVWHTRVSLDDEGGENYWNVRFAVSAYNTVLFTQFYRATSSEYQKYRIYKMSPDSFVDISGNAIPRERTTGIKFDGQGEILIQSLELVTNNGSAVGMAGTSPNVMLQVSFDGGFTWSSEKWAKAGKVGQYNYRTIWRNLGRGSKVSFRVRFTDPAPFNIATAYMTYTLLKNRVG